MHEDKAILLAEALESGEFPQTSTALCRLEPLVDGLSDGKRVIYPTGYCCLGVACEIALRNGVEMVVLDGIERSYDGESTYLPSKVMEFFGFKTHTGSVGVGPRIINPNDSEAQYVELASANDNKVPFAKIAAYIRANYETL